MYTSNKRIFSFLNNLFLVIFTLVIITSCASSKISGNRYSTTKVSYYHSKYVGRKTASGERYSHGKKTAAHRTLPFGTKVEMINPKNGKKVVIRVNDRFPSKPGRDFDLSQSAFRKLGNKSEGLIEVRYRILR